MKKSIKISKLRKVLLNLQKENGDLQVFMSSDPEGNSFNSIEVGGKESFQIEKEKDFIIIYPHFEHLDEEELGGR